MDRSVPDVTGMSIDEAQSLLRTQGFSWRVIGDGSAVTNQLPSPNLVAAAESEIILYAGSEPTGNTEEMPDLTGLTYSVARQRLGYYGLFIRSDNGSTADSSTIVVARQSIAPGTQVDHGTIVTVSLVDTDSSVYGLF